MEIRKDPFTGEYILVSPHRLKRPWQPEGACPFCPGAPETGRGWDVLILPNRYPVVTENPPEPTAEDLYEVIPARGSSLVVVETPQHDVDDLSDLPLGQIKKILTAVAEAQRKAEKEGNAAYFLFFRNKGKEIGVSLTHPHSQIYILPVVPPRVRAELQASYEWYVKHGSCLHCCIVEKEEKRLVFQNRNWKAFVPFYAKWPHEVHIYPKRHRSLLTELTDEEVADLAEALKITLCALKQVAGIPMPYIMVLHQAPLRRPTQYYHLHFEIYGMYRPDGKLKHAAGAELGASLFTLDTTPEETAARIKAALQKCLKHSAD
ncbi:MAG: galactose-1-phosphate uridylyltransferase [Pyrobaculum sp.]